MSTRRLLLLTLFLAGTVLVIEAQTRRIGSTREDQHPASTSSSPSRGEQRAPDPPPPPQHHDPPPQPVQPPFPVRPPLPSPPPPPPPPGGGVPIEGLTPEVTVQPVITTLSVEKDAAPLWPVIGTEIVDRVTDPGNAGYDFEEGDVVAFNDANSDIYYEADGGLLRVADDSDIQDLGPSKSVRENLRISRDGWSDRKAVLVQPRHQFAVWRWNGEVVRLYVEEVLEDAVVFDWMPGRSIERDGVKGPIFGR